MKAMILSAGYGSRLGNLTKKIPKPMLDVQGNPILVYIIYNLVAHGFDQIAINLHFNPEAITNYFGDGSQWGASIVYFYETELLGTAGGVKNMENFIKNENSFLIHYGDIITNQDFTKMLEFHDQKQAFATLLLHQRPNSNSAIGLDSDSRITSFLERPTMEQRAEIVTPWVNSGVCLCTPEIFQYIPEEKPSDLPKNVFAPLVPSKRLYGYPLSGYRSAIDSPERLEASRQAIAEGIPGLSSMIN